VLDQEWESIFRVSIVGEMRINWLNRYCYQWLGRYASFETCTGKLPGGQGDGERRSCVPEQTPHIDTMGIMRIIKMLSKPAAWASGWTSAILCFSAAAGYLGAGKNAEPHSG